MTKKLKWVGDLSTADVSVLINFANHGDILEFGSGGSTLIFSQMGAKSVVSVETNKDWIALTQERLGTLDSICPVSFKDYNSDWSNIYDIIFVDGIDEHRCDFAITSWKFLKPNGVMLFHDTRLYHNFQHVVWVAQLNYQEVSGIAVNINNSNITSLTKREKPLFYENWNEIENKPKWAYGIPDGVERTRLWTEEN